MILIREMSGKDFGIGFHTLEELTDGVHGFVKLLDLVADRRWAGKEDSDLASGGKRQCLLAVKIEWIGCRDLEVRVGHVDRQNVILPTNLFRHDLSRAGLTL